MADKFLNLNGLSYLWNKITGRLNTKQDTLVSGTNIKTINNNSLLGSGNINIESGGDIFVATYETTTFQEIGDAWNAGKQIVVDWNGEYYSGKTYYSDEEGDNIFNLTSPYGSNGMISFDITSNNEWFHSSYILARWQEATDNDLGLVKTNTNKSISLNADGQLEVGGRLGQFPTSLGLFAPDDREPRSVADYSLLITDAKGMTLGNRALAVVSGLGVTCKSASAGTTEYRVSNTYANRLLCKIAENGYASRDEATSKVEMTIPVVSVTIDGQPFTPDSSPNNSSKDIVITTETTLNPDSAITSIRLFPIMSCYSTAHMGNGIASWGGGRNFLLGGGVTKDGSGNDNCVVSNGAYVNGNGNAVFGRHHVVRKNRGFFAGQGHDNTNATGEGVSAIGQYSNITANTMFAIGNGSNHTTRLNLLEVLKDGRVKISGTPTEDDDVATKKYVDDNAGGGGEPTLTTYGNADFTYEKVLDPDTQEVINECIAYSTSSGNANEPTATKYGRVVNLAGAFKNINARPDNTAFDMGKVPVGCEPLKNQYILQQGTSQYKFMLTIRTDGTINCSRYSTGSSAVAVPNNAWLNINATYISAS